ncbi:MAG: HAD hydrolase family protein [Bdellovibrionota bacterium]
MVTRLIVYDFDGVLTDNRVWVTEDGRESVACNRSDGWWMGQIRKLGIEQIILSTEKNPVVSARARKLNIEAIQGQEDKKAALVALLEKKSLTPSDVCYIGNDMNDAGCMQIVGFSMCPNDSHPEILKLAKKTIPAAGGSGIVRHVYDWVVANSAARN